MLTLPRPISSARIPLMPWSYRFASQLRPFSWYSLSSVMSIFGWEMVKWSPISVGFWKLSSSESTASRLSA